ncbi:hypothetical protein IH979_02170 [Patescibacteria group bacterium]|nr:hypothetical protein [Patescibacteria group bacterium]
MQDQPQQEESKQERQEERQEGTSPKKKNYTNVIIGVIAIIVGILLIALLQQKGAAPKTEPTDESSEKTAEEVMEEKEPAVNLDYLLPADWDLTDRAERGIATLAKGQEIKFGIVTDPTDDTFVYFASSVYDSRQKENLVSIYKYNTDNYHFERLFRRTYSDGDLPFLSEETTPDFHVLGYDGGRLVMLAQDRSDSPRSCAEPLLLGAKGSDVRTLISINVDDPYGGFDEYTPSQELIDAAQKRQTECEAELEA